MKYKHVRPSEISPIVEIDAAVVFPEAKIFDTDDGDVAIQFAEPNPEYRWLMRVDGFCFASKDRKEWVVTPGVIINGEKISPKEVCEIACKLAKKYVEDRNGSIES